MSFSLLIISPEQRLASEPRVLAQLFAADLTTFHVRKPNWTRAELETYLKVIPAQYHPRLVLHSHYELALEYPLKGIHLTTRARQEPGLGRLLRQLRGRSISASLHSLAEVARHRRRYDYVFLSPIFDSTSKADYRSGFKLAEVQQARVFVVRHHKPDAGGFRAAHCGGASYQKLSLFLCRHLRPIHAHS